MWAHVEPGTAAALARYLDSMRFMLRVEVTDESARTPSSRSPAPSRPRTSCVDDRSA